MRVGQIGVAIRALAGNRVSLLYTLALMPLFGVFSSYLASSERMIGKVFERPGLFSWIFGGTAVIMGAASLWVARQVERVGLHRLIRGVLWFYTASSAGMTIISIAAGGAPNLWLWLVALSIALACHQMLFPQMNAGAMMPVGHVAGAAAAIIGTFSTVGGAVVGAVVDAAFNNIVTPFSVAFFAAGVIGIVTTGYQNQVGAELFERRDDYIGHRRQVGAVPLPGGSGTLMLAPTPVPEPFSASEPDARGNRPSWWIEMVRTDGSS